MYPFRDRIFLGTIAIERNRWGSTPATRFGSLKRFLRGYSAVPTERASVWMDRSLADGFDGVELFEPHAVFASDEELDRIAAHALPVSVFNAYFGLDDPDETWRAGIADLVVRLGARSVKFNVGKDPARIDAEVAALREFADALPPETRLLCECHAGSHTETPAGAARLLERWDDPRLQFVVHLADAPEHLAAWMSALGARTTHVHVWNQDPAVCDDARESGVSTPLSVWAPPLPAHATRLAHKVRCLRELGFSGSLTVEFTRSVRWGQPDPAAEVLYREAVEDQLALRRATEVRLSSPATP